MSEIAFTGERAESRPRSYDPASAWDEPDARLLNGGPRVAPALPLDCFGTCGPWLAAVAASRGAPVDYVAAPMLAFVAGIVGAAREVRIRPNWTEQLILWVASVGNPSSGKSPALAALKRAAARIEREEAGDAEARRGEYEARKIEAEALREKWEQNAKEAAKNNRAAAPMPAEAQEPPEPTPPRLLVADATTEKLARIIAQNPRGVLLSRDELSGLLGNFGKYGGADEPFYLQAFNGEFSPIDRQKGGTVTAARAYLSLVGSIQPDKFQALLSGRANDGLVARFLAVWPDLTQRVFRVPEVDDSRALHLFRRLRSLSMDADETGELAPRVLPLSADAATIFEAWYLEQGEKVRAASGFMAEFLGKADGICARLALALELLEWAASDDGPADGPAKVSARSVERACTLIVDYFEPMARRVYADAALPEVERKAIALIKELQARGVRTFNAREARREWGVPGLSSAADMEAACAVLIEGDCIRKIESQKGAGAGRKALTYAVNPRLLRKAGEAAR